MADLSKKKDDIIKLLFYINLIFLLISIFYISKWFIIILLLINILLLGSFFIIAKNEALFENMTKTNRVAKKFDKKLGDLYG